MNAHIEAVSWAKHQETNALNGEDLCRRQGSNANMKHNVHILFYFYIYIN